MGHPILHFPDRSSDTFASGDPEVLGVAIPPYA
jgi:hypothetical protein